VLFEEIVDVVVRVQIASNACDSTISTLPRGINTFEYIDNQLAPRRFVATPMPRGHAESSPQGGIPNAQP
jgi:hypothetical protein